MQEPQLKPLGTPLTLDELVEKTKTFTQLEIARAIKTSNEKLKPYLTPNNY